MTVQAVKLNGIPPHKIRDTEVILRQNASYPCRAEGGVGHEAG